MKWNNWNRITKITRKYNDEDEENGSNVEKNKELKITQKEIKNKEKSFIESRLAWKKLFDYPIPKHANDVTYTLGGTIIVLGIVQLITGVILQQFYIPNSNSMPGAYESVSEIANNVSLGFVRNLHYWGAQFLIIMVLLHSARVFISGAYKKPREIQWLAGVGLLVTVFAFSYTGTVLKWDQEGTEALEHQIGTAKIAGPLGIFLTEQFAPSVSLLSRIFALHVTAIPAIAVPLLGIHLILIRLNGISSPKVWDKYKDITARVDQKVPFSTHINKMLINGAVVTIIVIAFSLIWSAPLYFKGVEGVEVTKPPWFLLWLYPLENIFGVPAIAYTTIFVIILFVAVPIVDRKEVTDPRQRNKMMIVMFLLLLSFVGLMIMGTLSPSMQHNMG